MCFGKSYCSSSRLINMHLLSPKFPDSHFNDSFFMNLLNICSHLPLARSYLNSQVVAECRDLDGS